MNKSHEPKTERTERSLYISRRVHADAAFDKRDLRDAFAGVEVEDQPLTDEQIELWAKRLDDEADAMNMATERGLGEWGGF